MNLIGKSMGGVRLIYLLFIIVCSNSMLYGQAGQIAINRIELMPNEPSPFNLRDWKEVAMQYDSFVYDASRSGQYLPLINFQSNGVNYPENEAYSLHTYVGTNSPFGKEAINILPSLVGASLVGIDKSRQFGRNWILMSQDFFNRNNRENIYLNNPGASSGNDWWYDMMPNIYFLQLYDLYSDTIGEAAVQLTSIADQFALAVRKMGGNDTPWEEAYMNYRAWDFVNMVPNANGVEEPEAAGAFAWTLYNAWTVTGHPEYLKAAEWSLEFLNQWNSNPSYELQLPYGIYTAARMNAELNTSYDIEKMMNWAFNRGSLRGWGAIVGRWGGLDVSGLIGEANDNGNDYAFQMNGVQQAAALAPMVRYDKRFARAVGKWMLNMTNATRLFFPGFLPSSLQDASDWSNQYDPDRVIGYEALREVWQGNTPFSTGDAVNGDWAATNLALYGTSSIGYLGAIVSETTHEKVLQIDVLKTDFFNAAAYPTYLYYNPTGSPQSIIVPIGDSIVDVYEAISESFLTQNVNQEVIITIPADEAVLITLAPAQGDIRYEENRMLINDVVVDYRQSAQINNYSPRIQALAPESFDVVVGDTILLYGKVQDKDSQSFMFHWNVDGGTVIGEEEIVEYVAPDTTGTIRVAWIVTDDTNLSDTAEINIRIVEEINLPPEIISITTSSNYVEKNGVVDFIVEATDPNQDSLSYTWTATTGTISFNAEEAQWTAPDTEGAFDITVHVSDGVFTTTMTTSIFVRNFTPTSGDLIAHYPFLANGDDVSGNLLHGTIFGALFVPDRVGVAASAIRLDGFNDRMTVEDDIKLNFRNAITLSCWINPAELSDREMFIVSHGSWQNRWKLSIIPDQKYRWTINAENAIGDLDSREFVVPEQFVHLTATYDGEWMLLYVDGALSAYRRLSGAMRTTTSPLLVGQMLPDNIEYNFKGLVDDVKLFDYALDPIEVKQLYESTLTGVSEKVDDDLELLIYPNPVESELILEIDKLNEPIIITIANLHGQIIGTYTLQDKPILRVDVQNWSNGLYLMTIQTKQGLSTKSFIKI